jgi:enoyl-CoA hydratase
MSGEVLTEDHGGILQITIHRPERRNAVNQAVSEGIAAALDQLDEREDLGVGILTGAGGTFCSGMDLRAFLDGEVPTLPGREAMFGVPEVKRGLTAAGGALFRLPRRIPFHAAMEMVLTGALVPAARAAELGLVGRLVAPGQAVAAARELAETVAANGPLAVQASKTVMWESLDWPLAEGFDRQSPWTDAVRSSDDAAEGARAFTGKRPPVWSGR